MGIQIIYFKCLFVLFLGVATNALGHDGASGVVKERMEYFKQSKNNLKAIKAHIARKNYESIIPLAIEIRDWAGKMTKYFPEGSGVDPSEAAPEVWSDFEGFEKAALLHFDAANKLISSAKSKNQKNIVEAFGITASTCKSCHQLYRVD